MSTVKSLAGAALILSAVSLSGCASTPDASKDYTVKTVKMSPAPRDKFWKIVKVPKTPAPACTDGKTPDGATCATPPKDQ